MREVSKVFERKILYDDLDYYSDNISKHLILDKNDLVGNVLNELQDGSSFIKNNKIYIKQSGELYTQEIQNDEIVLIKIKTEDI